MNLYVGPIYFRAQMIKFWPKVLVLLFRSWKFTRFGKKDIWCCLTKSWPQEVWHAILLPNNAYLAPRSYIALPTVAKAVHIKFGDPFKLGFDKVSYIKINIIWNIWGYYEALNKILRSKMFVDKIGLISRYN